MVDLMAGDKTAYREAVERAEAAAGAGNLLNTEQIPEDVVLPDAEAPEVAAEDAPTPEVVETPVAEETPAERLLAGRFKSVEELERGYEESLLLASRQGNEIGDLRKAFDERFAQFEEQQNQRQVEADRVPITQELIFENPGQATRLAHAQGDNRALPIAFQAWHAENPDAAETWRELQLTRSEMGRTVAEQQKALKDIQDHQQQVSQTYVQPQQEAAVWSDAVGRVAQEYPDVGDHIDFMLNEIAPKFPKILTNVLTGDADARYEGLSALYEIARGRNADNLKDAVSKAAKETADEAQQARTDAFVASQDTGSATETLSYEESEKQKAIDRIRTRQDSFSRNWTGRKNA